MLKIDVKAKGPVFTNADPTLRRHAQNAIRNLVELGEQRLDQTLKPRPGGVYLTAGQAGKGKASTGHYRRNINSRVTPESGRIDDGGVIYGPWLEGIGSRNQSTRFKGYASFRRVGQWLQKKAKGIAQVHVGRAVRDLQG